MILVSNIGVGHAQWQEYAVTHEITVRNARYILDQISEQDVPGVGVGKVRAGCEKQAVLLIQQLDNRFIGQSLALLSKDIIVVRKP